MNAIRRIFTWWNGATVGTMLHTRREGVQVGADAEGNTYWTDRAGKRRWVIYAGEAEASRVPPDWHGWLHHTFDRPPTEAPLPVKPWEKPHAPNLTGTSAAYAPPGSIAAPRPPKKIADYEPWSPEGA
jgi:NADH:ubiquinone oxidoreductase subunit